MDIKDARIGQAVMVTAETEMSTDGFQRYTLTTSLPHPKRGVVCGVVRRYVGQRVDGAEVDAGIYEHGYLRDVTAVSLIAIRYAVCGKEHCALPSHVEPCDALPLPFNPPSGMTDLQRSALAEIMREEVKLCKRDARGRFIR
jgi:hypothetical protein